MERIFGTLELRAVNDDERVFEGVANTAALDDHGTIIEPAGARFKLPIPLLWQHDQDTPVGEITEARLVDGKWRVRGTIRKIEEAGPFKDATDRAWQGVKHRLVRGLSIGFIALKRNGNRLLEWALREISIVTIPSNQEATIEMVRSSFATSGEPQPQRAGVSVNYEPPNPKRGTTMTIQEQITQHENSRAAKVARQSALMEASGAAGVTLSTAEQEEFDTLDTEVRSHDDHLGRLRSLKRANEATATVVNDGGAAPAGTRAASEVRGGAPVVSARDNTKPGIGFARYAMSLLACRGNRFEAAEYARRAFGDGASEVVNALQTRAAVAPGTTVNSTFAAPLVQTNFLDEFLELLRPATLIGRIPGLKRVPFNISMPSQTAGGTYKWVGEGLAKPLTNMAFGSVTLGLAKASGIIVLTEELVRSSAPSAQEAVRDELLKGIPAFLDVQFIDPTVAAVANVNPASITNGVAGTAASGTTEAAARADLRALLAGFATGNYGLGSVVLLMSESVAFTLGTMVNAVGEPAFPGLTATGGSILGIPVVTSNALGTQIVAVHSPSVLLADEGGVEIDVSREASLQMDSAPDNPATASTVLVSLFQNNLVALRAERFINWGKARTDAVRRIHTVAYA